MANVFLVDSTSGTVEIKIKSGEMIGPNGAPITDTTTIQCVDSSGDSRGPVTRSIIPDLRLYGFGVLSWGEGVDENFYRLMENFACPQKVTDQAIPRYAFQGAHINDVLYENTSQYPTFDPSIHKVAPQDERDLGPGRGVNNPAVGQAWFNTTTGQMYVYSGCQWTRVGVPSTSVPPNPVDGELWYDEDTNELKVYTLVEYNIFTGSTANRTFTVEGARAEQFNNSSNGQHVYVDLLPLETTGRPIDLPKMVLNPGQSVNTTYSSSSNTLPQCTNQSATRVAINQAIPSLSTCQHSASSCTCGKLYHYEWVSVTRSDFYTKTESDNLFVKLAGDTMTGGLSIEPTTYVDGISGVGLSLESSGNIAIRLKATQAGAGAPAIVMYNVDNDVSGRYGWTKLSPRDNTALQIEGNVLDNGASGTGASVIMQICDYSTGSTIYNGQGSISYNNDIRVPFAKFATNDALITKKYLSDILESDTSLTNYYTKTETDNKFVELAGDTMTGRLILSEHPTSSSSAYQAATKRYVEQYVDDNIAGAVGGIDIGFPRDTQMVFYQASAPTGWVQVTTGINATYGGLLRVVRSGGGGYGGADNPIYMDKVPSHTHVVSGNTGAGSPHNHNIYGSTSAITEDCAGARRSTMRGFAGSRSSEGEGYFGTFGANGTAGIQNESSHAHAFYATSETNSGAGVWQPLYVDMIVARKDY